MLHSELPEYAREYWQIFKSNCRNQAQLKVLGSLKEEGASLLDFYLAATFSQSKSLDYNFKCIKLMRERFAAVKLYLAPFEVWKVLHGSVVYCGLEGKLDLLQVQTGKPDQNQGTLCKQGDFVATFSDIRLVGSREFVSSCLSALTLISAQCPEELEFIRTYVGQIVESKKSGMYVDWKPPTFHMAADVYEASRTWCASCISHEARHSMLYQNYLRDNPGNMVPYSEYAGQKVEMICMKAQAEVLRKIGAPAAELEYLGSLDGSHGGLPH